MSHYRMTPTEPLTVEEERDLRSKWAEFLDVMNPDYQPIGAVPRLLATLDAAREPAGRDVLREALGWASQALLELVNEGWSSRAQRSAMAYRDQIEKVLADPAPGGETDATTEAPE